MGRMNSISGPIFRRPISQCSECLQGLYCSTECQDAHWGEHWKCQPAQKKTEVPATKKNWPQRPRTFARPTDRNPRDLPLPTIMSLSKVVPHMQDLLLTVAKGRTLDAVEFQKLVLSELKRCCPDPSSQDKKVIKKVVMEEVAMCNFLITMEAVKKQPMRNRCAFFVTPSSRQVLPEYDGTHRSTSQSCKLAEAMHKSCLKTTYDELIALSVLVTGMYSARRRKTVVNNKVATKGIWVVPTRGAIEKAHTHSTPVQRPTKLSTVHVYAGDQLGK